jgi:hypothetical protein
MTDQCNCGDAHDEEIAAAVMAGIRNHWAELLGLDGKIRLKFLPALAITNVVVAESLDGVTGMDEGDVARLTDGTAYIYDGITWLSLRV